jgi:hypothetical protein
MTDLTPDLFAPGHIGRPGEPTPAERLQQAVDAHHLPFHADRVAAVLEGFGHDELMHVVAELLRHLGWVERNSRRL